MLVELPARGVRGRLGEDLLDRVTRRELVAARHGQVPADPAQAVLEHPARCGGDRRQDLLHLRHAGGLLVGPRNVQEVHPQLLHRLPVAGRVQPQADHGADALGAQPAVAPFGGLSPGQIPVVDDVQVMPVPVGQQISISADQRGRCASADGHELGHLPDQVGQAVEGLDQQAIGLEPVRHSEIAVHRVGGIRGQPTRGVQLLQQRRDPFFHLMRGVVGGGTATFVRAQPDIESQRLADSERRPATEPIRNMMLGEGTALGVAHGALLKRSGNGQVWVYGYVTRWDVGDFNWCWSVRTGREGHAQRMLRARADRRG